MATLPGGDWLIQQSGGEVILFHRDTEVELVRFNPADPSSFGPAMEIVASDDRLNTEQKIFAGFWSGYFYAYATK